MDLKKAKNKIAALLERVDVRVNGDRPWDIQVIDERLYARVLAQGSIGIGEAYMDGWWNVKKLDAFFSRVIRGNLPEQLTWNLPTLLLTLQARFLNMQTEFRSTKVAKKHYDLGNDFYMSFLDPYNQYTCGYFKGTHDLNEAQENKLDLICRKLQLSSKDHVLDIGCGWGGFARFASDKYGCHVTGVSISSEQIKYAREFTKGLPVEIINSDYRKLAGTFDKVLICGMIEHVGYKNYGTIMKKVSECLKKGGLYLVHTIGSNRSNRSTDPWMSKYIFPNSMTPSMAQLTRAAEPYFVLEDWQNIGLHYVKTLKAWFDNFEANWDQFKDSYGDRFYRMWKYYLLGSAGFFASRKGQLWQLVFSKDGLIDGYQVER